MVKTPSSKYVPVDAYSITAQNSLKSSNALLPLLSNVIVGCDDDSNDSVRRLPEGELVFIPTPSLTTDSNTTIAGGQTKVSFGLKSGRDVRAVDWTVDCGCRGQEIQIWTLPNAAHQRRATVGTVACGGRLVF
jgi:hypothetical protein